MFADMPPRMMSDIDIAETSGVDHPAHLTEGWVVIKSATTDAVTQALEALTKETAMPAETTDAVDESVVTDEMLKAMPAAVRDMLAKSQSAVAEAVAKAAAAEASAAATAETLRKERDDRREVEKSAFLKGLSQISLGDDPAAMAKALRELEDANPELAKAVETALAAANGQVESAALFTELGKSSTGTGSDAYEKLTILAKARAEADGSSFAVAMEKCATAEPELYAQYRAELAR